MKKICCGIFWVVFLPWAYAQLENYTTYHLESICKQKESEGKISIPPWGAAILKIGHSMAYDGSQASTKIHKCNVNVVTAKGFGLAAVVEDMNIRGIKDRTTNQMECDDYVQFTTVGSSKFHNILNKVLPGDPFKDKSSKRLCGQRHNAGDNIKKIRLEEISTQASIFHTRNPNIEVSFHQDQNPYQTVNNSFTLVLTTFRHQSDTEFSISCDDRFKCMGPEVYCINEAFQCDNHINCAFPNSGRDELCKTYGPSPHPVFSTTTTIITTLACIVGAGLVVCCLFTIVMKIKSKRRTVTDYPMDDVQGSQGEMLPQLHLQRQQTLPRYEAVVMADAEHWNSINIEPTPVDPKDVPPSYEHLFPNGPPKLVEAEEINIIIPPKDTSAQEAPEVEPEPLSAPSAPDFTPPAEAEGTEITPRVDSTVLSSSPAAPPPPPITEPAGP
ncbi:unnamed protein product [Meganyctiphanes norvegica]|uniref:Uncharacterized protein n=1 Tax=Meganyctiphanes norvegica TaxID=48144 RepID=A0AAV2QR56_MEGNR